MDNNTTYVIWYGVTSFILGLLLFFPMRKFMTAMGVNKLQRRENRAATEEEKASIRRRASLYAAIISVTFAFLYNKVIMFKYFKGVQ